MFSVGIFADLHDWHTKELKMNLEKNGCKVYVVDISKIKLEFNNKKNFLSYCSNILKLDAVWVRFIGKGTLEEITTKLTVLHLLESKKTYVHNSAGTIEKTVDKVRSSGLLKINNIKTPETIVWCKNQTELPSIELHGDYLIKPIFGSQGKNIYFIKNLQSLKKINPIGNIFYIQKFIGNKNDSEFSDVRILISNHKVVCGMKRTSKKFITNVFQGASFKKFKISKELKVLCRNISKIFDLGYGGIDFKIWKKKIYVLEINGIPSWKAIQTLERKNISEILVMDFLEKIRKR